MPADQGGSSGTRTTKSKGIGQSLGRSAARVGNTSGKSSARKSYGGSRRSKSSGGSSRGYSSGGGSSRRSSGGGGGYSGGGGGGSSKPSAPSLAAYLKSDSGYQNALRGTSRSLTDFLSESSRRRGEATTQFNQTTASMNRDRDMQLDALRQEFASRGLINSGLFGEEQGRFQQQFTDQLNALNQQQTSLLADLLSQEKNYRREIDLQNADAREQALARRAAKYGV